MKAFRTAHAPDPRLAVWEVAAAAAEDGLRLEGETTNAELADRLLAEARAALGPVPVADGLSRLPLTDAGCEQALVRSALAPVYSEPRLPAAQITQFVLGMRLDILGTRERWLRVRAEDGYLGWVHQGYLHRVERDAALAWEEARDGEPVVSLGAELYDAEDQPLLRLPWGARLRRAGPLLVLPDGNTGVLGTGEVVDVDRLADRFPPRGESAVRTARRWIGAPYLWGGVTLAGVDCSGLVQAVCWMHGVALPRDTDLQARAGVPIDAGPDFARLRPGDLLFFAESGERVTHVTMALEGPLTVHASLTNGGVAVDDLTSDAPASRFLRPRFVGARRLFPD